LRSTSKLSYLRWASLGIAVFAIATLSGCSTSGRVVAVRDQPTTEPTSEAHFESSEPFAIEVLNEVNDGQRLAVMTQVTAHSKWDSREVAVRLTTLRNGVPEEEKIVQLSSVMPGGGIETGESLMLNPGQRVPFLLTVSNAADVASGGRASDYQLELLWGNDARAILPTNNLPLPSTQIAAKVQSPPGEVGAGSISPVQILTPQLVLKGSHCDGTTSTQCQATFVLQAALLNTSADRLVQNIDLDLGIEQLSEKLDMQVPLLQTTERVNLTNVGLKPGQRRSISLTIERQVARADLNQSVAETFRPILKLIDAR